MSSIYTRLLLHSCFEHGLIFDLLYRSANTVSALVPVEYEKHKHLLTPQKFKSVREYKEKKQGGRIHKDLFMDRVHTAL